MDNKLKEQLAQVFESHANMGKQLNDLRTHATNLGDLLFEIARLYHLSSVPQSMGTVNFMAGTLNVFCTKFLNALAEHDDEEINVIREQLSFVLILQTYIQHLSDKQKQLPNYQKEIDFLNSKMKSILTDTKGNIL